MKIYCGQKHYSEACYDKIDRKHASSGRSMSETCHKANKLAQRKSARRENKKKCEIY